MRIDLKVVSNTIYSAWQISELRGDPREFLRVTSRSPAWENGSPINIEEEVLRLGNMSFIWTT